MAKTVHISAYVDPDEAEDFRGAAASDQRTISDALRVAMRDYARRTEARVRAEAMTDEELAARLAGVDQLQDQLVAQRTNGLRDDNEPVGAGSLVQPKRTARGSTDGARA